MTQNGDNKEPQKEKIDPNSTEKPPQSSHTNKQPKGGTKPGIHPIESAKNLGKSIDNWLLIPCNEKLKPWDVRLKNCSILNIFDRLSKLAILVTVIVSICKLDDIKRERQYEAWRNTSGTQKRAEAGAKFALESLHQDNVSLELLDAPKKVLRGINLENANLYGAKLSTTDLRGSKLNGVNFTGAFLENAYLNCFETSNGKMCTELRNTDFFAAKLHRADLSGADLKEADFGCFFFSKVEGYRCTDLSGSDLSDTNLEGANLHRANLYKAYLVNADYEPYQIKSACYWDEAFYKGDFNQDNTEWILNEKANQEHIDKLKQKQYPKTKKPLDCNKDWPRDKLRPKKKSKVN